MLSFVLTQNELMVIRAAVRFWMDENGTDSELLQFYSGVFVSANPTPIDVTELNGKLQGVGLRYLICHKPELRPTTDQTYQSAEDAVHAATGEDAIVTTVLVTESE